MRRHKLNARRCFHKQLIVITAFFFAVHRAWTSIQDSRRLSIIRVAGVRQPLESLKVAQHNELTTTYNENNTVSILTFSNGQQHCDENAFLNAYYQQRPSGIQMVELLFYETSIEPSQRWKKWANEYYTSNFRVIYQWFNSSEPKGSKLNPKLGNLRNAASQAAHGKVLINMDNDDIYHPNFVSYVLHHMELNTWHHLVVGNHASVMFNPDGSHKLIYGQDRKLGAHMWSFSREVFTRFGCLYLDAAAGEEKTISPCMERNKLGYGRVSMVNGTLGNPLLLIKVNSPLSITMQKWFKRRELFNRLTANDLENVMNSMRKFYRDVHTLQAPLESSSHAPNMISEALPPVRGFEEFHDRHPHFMSKTNYPHCTGFAGMPGQTFQHVQGKTLLMSAPDAKACCRMCSDMSNVTAAQNSGLATDDIHNSYCAAFTFDMKAKTCLLGWGLHSFTPWTVSTHEAGTRIDPACPKCGAKLDGKPLK